QRLNKSNMPWITTNDVASSKFIHPSSQETCRLLRTYNNDIARAKFFAKIAPNSPTGIPSSQWEQIFRGDAVDLNQILTSLHHVSIDEERKGRVGDAEISFGVPEAKKHVRTASEWSSAWRRASKAIAPAFPHRRDKLLNYGDYIEEEFAATLHSSHHQIILYNIALQNEVGAGQHVLLTETHHFTRLYSAIIMPDGIKSHSVSSATKKPTTFQNLAKPKICNKFNNSSCKMSNADCNVCKNCKRSGHGKKDCPGGT
ncbi:hypothetical protein BYT27DRAFT_7107170, partial [Phlegmacium glaucopus]